MKLEHSSFPRLFYRLMIALVASVYLVAGLFKIVYSTDFELSILHAGLFPEWTVVLLVFAIPAIEVIAGLLCLFSSTARMSLAFLLILTCLYTGLIFWEWIRGIDPDCGCFGPASSHWSYFTLYLRNGFLLGTEVWLLYLLRSDGDPKKLVRG